MNNNELLNILSIKTIKDTENNYYTLIIVPKTTDKLIIRLTDLFNTNGIEFLDFINSFNESEDIKEFLTIGTETFLPIDNYLIPKSTADKYEIENEDIIVPNVYKEDLTINEYWNVETESNTFYYIMKNKMNDYIFSEDELNALNSTFMKTIIKWSTFDDYSYGKNSVYKAVIDFYANGGYDSATILMNTVFNTEINTTLSYEDCGCGTQNTCTNTTSNGLTSSINTGTTTISLDTATCLDKYKAAMYQWLQQMLSDTDFYCCWMMTYMEDTKEDIPNDVLIDLLISLLKEFLSLGYDLSNLGNTSNSTCGCGHKGKGNIYTGDCPDILNNDNLNNQCSNYNIILNYIKVLEWVKNNEIEENKNKIYVYGKQFAQIFPLLNF